MNALALHLGGRRMVVRDTRRRRNSVRIGVRLYDHATVTMRIDGQTITLTDVSMEMSDPVPSEPIGPMRFSARIALNASGAEAFLNELSRVPLPISMSATNVGAISRGPVVATQTVDVAKLPVAVDVTVKGVVPAPVVFAEFGWPTEVE